MKTSVNANKNASKIIFRMREIIELEGAIKIGTNEQRIWGMENDEKVGQIVKNIFTESFEAAKKYYKTDKLKYTIMGNIVKKGSTGSGGGWHQDSQLSRQYKAFCYLTYVNDEDDGALQYFKYFETIVLSAISKLFFNYSNRISSNLIKLIGFNPITVTGEVGSIFSLDTRLIHRGAPVKNEQRERIAVTLYIYSEKKYPKEIYLSELK
jgi:hypothetical protein